MSLFTPRPTRASRSGTPRPPGAAAGAASAPSGSKPSSVLKRWTFRLGLVGLGLGAVGLTFVLFGLAGLQVALRLREVGVPDLTSQSVEEATATLADAGLELRIEPLSRIDHTIPAGRVAAQDPASGLTTRSRRSVKVWLSSGSSAGAIPALIGLSQRGALARLEEDALGLGGVAEIRSSRYPSNAVVAQDPPPLASGATVSVLLNRGERGATYVMPDLIGLYGASAAEILRAREFRVTVVGDHPYPGVPPGIVLRQFPRAGFQIAHGEAISLEVSR